MRGFGAMRLFMASVAALVLVGACVAPEVDLELPNRSIGGQSPTGATPPTEGPTGTTSGDVTTGSQDPSSVSEPGSVPGSADLDELEQLVSEIEALLDGVSGELDQITFEEEEGS